jgi:hypothetical protein
MLRLARNGPASFTLLAIALLTGLLGGYLLASPPPKAEFCTLPFDSPDHVYPGTSPSQHTPQPLQSAEGSLLASDDLGLEALRSIVAGTRGYYARDYSMHLGWNNVSHYPSQCVRVLALTRL